MLQGCSKTSKSLPLAQKEIVVKVSRLIMTLSDIPMSPLSNELSSLYTSNSILNNSPTNPNNYDNHNHYHPTNQYQQHHTRSHQNQDYNSQLLSILFPRDLNRTNKQTPQLAADALIPSTNYDSYSFFSFLYAETDKISSTVSPHFNSAYSDYEGIGTTVADDSVQDAFVEGSHLWSLLVVGYSIVFIIGVIGNSVLLAALCGSGSRARALPVRNHLMVNLAAADLLVTAICVPISACAAASHACWPSFLVSHMCQLGPLLQRTPVAASTLSLALLSLDRWAAIRVPRFAQRFRERRFVAMSMAIIWMLASLVAAPTLWAREWDTSSWATNKGKDEDELTTTEDFRGNVSTENNHWTKSGVCVERWTNIGVHLTYAATYLGTAFVTPALIVAACHASVSHKLTAQLKILTGATSGDRMNSNRPRPKQVLIVAHDPQNNPIDPMSPPINNPMGLGFRGRRSPSRSGSMDGPVRPSRKFVPCDPNSDDEDDIFVRMQIESDLESLRYQQNLGKSSTGSRRGVKSISTFRSEAPDSKNNNILKAATRETSIIRAHRRLRKKLNVPVRVPAPSKMPPGPLLPYSSQSFRSRRRAASLLAALSVVFICCWGPFVVCALLEMFLKDKSMVRLVIPFCLFLGHLHSAINPVVSWRLNRSAFVRFQKQPILSFLPEWFRSIATCRLFCYSCTCPRTCCEKSGEQPATTTPGQGESRRPPFRRAGTRYPGITNDNRNPFLNTPAALRMNHRDGNMDGNSGTEACCYGAGNGNDDAEPCCCFLCPGGRRSSSPEWNRNTSTNEAQLGAFHPRFLNRLPMPDPISKCHTSHFLR